MSEPININKANLTQLKTIKGIGDAKAQAIIRAREQQGPLNSANVFEITYISSTSWSSLLEDNLTFGAELSEEDLSSVVLMLRDKISSLQEEHNSLADRFNLQVEKAKEQTFRSYRILFSIRNPYINRFTNHCSIHS
jgi:ribosomal protein S13